MKSINFAYHSANITFYPRPNAGIIIGWTTFEGKPTSNPVPKGQ